MSNRVIPVDEKLPLLETIPLSLQHLFAMFGSTVLVPILFKVNPATVLLFNGIGTLLYLILCRGKIPAYLGSSFAFLSPVFLVLSQYSYEAALGGFITVGIIFCLVGGVVHTIGTIWIDFLFPPAANYQTLKCKGRDPSGCQRRQGGQPCLGEQGTARPGPRMR